MTKFELTMLTVGTDEALTLGQMKRLLCEHNAPRLRHL